MMRWGVVDILDTETGQLDEIHTVPLDAEEHPAAPHTPYVTCCCRPRLEVVNGIWCVCHEEIH
jgi:hypothetical protein